MHRRELLATAGSLFAAGGSVAGDEGGPTPTTEPASERTTSATPRTSDDGGDAAGEREFDPAATYLTLVVGDRTNDARSHVLAVWNAASADRTLALRVEAHRDGGETSHEGRYELPADAALDVEFAEPAEYRVALCDPTHGTRETFHLRRDGFDCNSSGHRVAVRPDGEMETTGWTTLVGCNVVEMNGTHPPDDRTSVGRYPEE